MTPPLQLTLLQRWYPSAQPAPCTPLRIAGLIPVILVLALQILAYITVIPGTYIPLLPTHSLLCHVLIFLFHLMFLSTITNYLLLVFLDPGSPPATWRAPPPKRNLRHDHPTFADEDFQFAHVMKERSYDASLRYCYICAAYKPDRSHHCSVCKRCILRMDHHCIFINNCVSFANHKFFISFVTFAFLGCLQIAITSFPTFLDIVSISSTHARAHAGKFRTLMYVSKLSSALNTYSAAARLSPPFRTLVMIGYITSTAFAFALAIFVILHFYLVAKGRTTIELYEITDPTRAGRVAEYDLGFRKNFRKVCGRVPLCWFLPTRAYVEGDGVSYETRSEQQNFIV